MINMYLYKQLPYEIRYLLYIIISIHYKKIHENKTKRNILDIINNVDNKLNYVKYLNDNELILHSDYYFFAAYRKHIIEINSLNLSKKFMEIKNFEKKYKEKKKKVREQEDFKILNNCPNIRELYGDFLYLYYLNSSNNWVKLSRTFPYGSVFTISRRIPGFNLKIRENLTFMVSHIDLTNITLPPTKIRKEINNPIFKFSTGELINNHFKFNEKNLTYETIFVN